ncbi:MAG: hypothetical protein UU09_C0010G0017 [Microgenomates group bacterium GW2011_GWA2_40_6]|nr:MAG: hypothetical protein UU09_C0010G0017 [Microgenomates group bacterium GW2011_GWA2_40_6]
MNDEKIAGLSLSVLREIAASTSGYVGRDGYLRIKVPKRGGNSRQSLFHASLLGTSPEPGKKLTSSVRPGNLEAGLKILDDTATEVRQPKP